MFDLIAAVVVIIARFARGPVLHTGSPKPFARTAPRTRCILFRSLCVVCVKSIGFLCTAHTFFRSFFSLHFCLYCVRLSRES